MKRYESMLRADEKKFLTSNMDTIEHFLGILERRTEKAYYESCAEGREIQRKHRTSIDDVSNMLQKIISEKVEVEEG